MTQPEIKTETISEVVFTGRQLLELVRTYYGAEVVPPHAEVKPNFNVADFDGVKFRWKNGSNTPPIVPVAMTSKTAARDAVHDEANG